MNRLLRPYISQMAPWAWLLGLGILLQLIALASSIGLLALSGWFLSASAVAGLSVATAQSFNYLLPSAGVRFFALARTTARYGERLVTHDATFRLLSKLRENVYRRLEPLSPAALQRIGESELMTRLTADVDALDTLYLRVMTPSIVALSGVVLCGVVIGIFAPAIGVFAALMLLIAGTLGPWLAWRAGRGPSGEWQTLNARLRTRLLERLNGLSEMLLYGRWQAEVESLLEGQKARDATEYRLARQWGNAQLLTQTLMGLALTGVLGLAALWVTRLNMDATLVALMGLAVMGAFEAVAMLPQAWQHLGRIERAAARLDDIERRVPEVHFPNKSAGRPTDWRLSIEGLTVRFDDGQSPLEGLDLIVEPREHLALLGPSGGGKTTLFNALVRFLEPVEGRITLGGVALDTLSESDLRKHFTVAAQQTHLFTASFRDNLTMGRGDIEDETIKALLSELWLDEWLASQPAGLDSFPDEGGSSLSGGQLRRFSTARALLQQAPIVLLDEPTEGLDEATERQVLGCIKNRCRDRSLIVITHRPTGLRDFDRVGVIDRGRLIEHDAPSRLLDDPESRLGALARELEPMRLYPRSGRAERDVTRTGEPPHA